LLNLTSIARDAVAVAQVVAATIPGFDGSGPGFRSKLIARVEQLAAVESATKAAT
jgi:tRNA(Met) C34 N-acetyltransferase TmcA